MPCLSTPQSEIHFHFTACSLYQFVVKTQHLLYLLAEQNSTSSGNFCSWGSIIVSPNQNRKCDFKTIPFPRKFALEATGCNYFRKYHRVSSLDLRIFYWIERFFSSWNLFQYCYARIICFGWLKSCVLSSFWSKALTSLLITFLSHWLRLQGK